MTLHRSMTLIQEIREQCELLHRNFLRPGKRKGRKQRLANHCYRRSEKIQGLLCQLNRMRPDHEQHRDIYEMLYVISDDFEHLSEPVMGSRMSNNKFIATMLRSTAKIHRDRFNIKEAA